MGDNGSRTRRGLLTTRRVLGLVLVAGLLAFLVLFVADNFVLIEIRLVNLRIQMRLAWALVCAGLIGATAGFLAGRLRR